ncbi:hypothetical protein ACFQY8_03325, partial [Alloscardovia venturai]
LIGAGLDALIQQGTTGNVDWGEVLISTGIGLATAGVFSAAGSGIMKIPTVRSLVTDSVEKIATNSVRQLVLKSSLGFVRSTAEDTVGGTISDAINKTRRGERFSFSDSLLENSVGPQALIGRVGGQSLEVRGRLHYGETYGTSPIQFGKRGYDKVNSHFGEDATHINLRTGEFDASTLYAPGEHYHSGNAMGLGDVYTRSTPRVHVFGPFTDTSVKISYQPSAHSHTVSRTVHVIDLFH